MTLILLEFVFQEEEVLIRRRIPGDRLHILPALRGLQGREALFPLDRALAGRMEFRLLPQFVERDCHQQPSDVVLLVELELAIPHSHAERAEGRLHDILGIHPPPEAHREMPLGDHHQLRHMLLEQLRRRILIARAQGGNQFDIHFR